MWLIVKTKANLRPELKMKIIWNTCERKHGGMKSVYENYYIYKKFIWKLRKATPS